MGLTQIYKDSTTEISILTYVARYLEYMADSYLHLSQEKMQELLDKTMNIIFDGEIKDLKDYNIVTSSTVPKLCRGEELELTEYSKIFEDAAFILTEYFFRTEGKLTLEQKEEIEKLVWERYKENYNEECMLHFYKEEDEDVSGFMSMVVNHNIYIFFFKLYYEERFNFFD